MLLILFNTGLTLFVMQREIILCLVFNREIGLQFFDRFRAFPVLGKHVIRPWDCVSRLYMTGKDCLVVAREFFEKFRIITIKPWRFIIFKLVVIMPHLVLS